MAYKLGGGGGPSTATGQMRASSIPTFSKTKSIAYGTTDQIYSASTSVADDAPSGSLPQRIEVYNDGTIPITIMAGYETFSNETSDSGATRYLHTMLMPGETYNPAVRALISTENASTQFDGTALSNQAPDSNEYTDSTADVDSATAAGIVNHATNTTVYLEPYTSATNCTANLFRVGDLIRVRDEVMEVTAIGDKSDLANNYLTVKRDMYGTDGGTSAVDDDPVRLPFFNAYHDFDKYSVAQTDANGKFKCFNFFGQGRSATGVQGILPGSVAIKFYNPGYQGLGLSGITSSTNTGLTASTEYKIDITVDGGTLFQDLSFTTDSSDLSFKKTIDLIQAAFNTQFYTAGNLFEKKVHVGIVNGDVRFTSGQHLSTSAILLADTGDSGSFIDAAANGRIPAIANIPTAVAARLPDDVLYDRITYATSPNNVFLHDNGLGRLVGSNGMSGFGNINYETGAIELSNCPPNGEFVYTVAHSSGFSGKLDTGTNAIVSILANCPSQKRNGSVNLKIF